MHPFLFGLSALSVFIWCFLVVRALPLDLWLSDFLVGSMVCCALSCARVLFFASYPSSAVQPFLSVPPVAFRCMHSFSAQPRFSVHFVHLGAFPPFRLGGTFFGASISYHAVLRFLVHPILIRHGLGFLVCASCVPVFPWCIWGEASRRIPFSWLLMVHLLCASFSFRAVHSFGVHLVSLCALLSHLCAILTCWLAVLRPV